jgi:hypothetical protein
MREMEVLRGHHSEVSCPDLDLDTDSDFDGLGRLLLVVLQVCSLAWHPQHESLLLSGGYNGSLIYWMVNQGQVASRHSLYDKIFYAHLNTR